MGLQDELKRSESKLATTSADLNLATTQVDNIARAMKTLETKNMIDEGRIDMLEGQVKESKTMVERSEIQYDESARKLAMVEGDLQRGDERAESGENKIVDLEEELRMIGENLKALEVAEEKAQQREEEYKKQIRTLSEKFKNAEARAEYGEKTVQKQNLRVDAIMFDLVSEKMRTQTVNDQLDETFELFMGQ